MGSTQLKLVTQAPEQPAEILDPTRRVFAHWLTMFGKSPNRCKMGPTRRRAIDAALTLYDEDQVLMAIEGAAADPWVCGDNPMRRPHDDVEWLLRDESSIERYSEAGERLRQRVRDKLNAREPESGVVVEMRPDPVKAAEGVVLLQRLAARLSGRAQ
jgi:hypothetical protein